MPLIKKSLTFILIITLSLVRFHAVAQKVVQPPAPAEWTRDYQPFRIAGNLYYVGTYELACYLISTEKGLILINTGVAESVPMIRAHIGQLGFKFADIKILLTNQAHFDHVSGMAEIKKVTGAKMMIDEKDAPVLADGGNSDFLFGGKGSLFEPVKADRLLHDRDIVKLGDMQITMLHHPGHTKGSCSFLFNVKDDKRSYRVLIANMPSVLEETNLEGMPTYPGVGSDYAYTYNAMKKLKFDLWLAAHASQFSLHEKNKPGDAYRPEAFMDQKGYDAVLGKLESDYLTKLNKK